MRSDLALDRSLGRGGIADLLADRHRLAELDQLREVLLDRVVRARPAILIGSPADCAALRERDVEQARRLLGVVEEQLVEIAHAVEQEHVGMLRLDAQVLLHHRRVWRRSDFRRFRVSLDNTPIYIHLMVTQIVVAT